MVNNASVFSRLGTIIMVNLVATFISLLMSFYFVKFYRKKRSAPQNAPKLPHSENHKLSSLSS